jgi:hypothetical protein
MKGQYDFWRFEDVNEYLRARDPRWVEGFLAAVNFVNDWRESMTSPHLIGDMALTKYNLIHSKMLRPVTERKPKGKKR